MKLILYEINVKSTFLNRYLEVKVNQVVSKHVTDKDGVIKKNDLVEVSMDSNIDINNMENVKLEDNENLNRVHMNVDDMSDKMVEHVVHQMQFELSMVKDISCLPNFQVKQMKDYNCNCQGVLASSSCTQLL